MRALILDDSRAMRSILRNFLGGEGFDVLEAGSGLDALELLRAQGPVELVLVDWNLPGVSGLEFVRTLRSDPAYDSTALMMVTTEVELNAIRAAISAGVQEYLMKPFTREILREKLNLVGIPPLRGHRD